MSIGGTGVTTDSNIYFRLMAIVFAGTMVFGVFISWRAQLLFNAEYVEFPIHRPAKKTTKAKDLIKKPIVPDIEELEK